MRPEKQTLLEYISHVCIRVHVEPTVVGGVAYLDCEIRGDVTSVLRGPCHACIVGASRARSGV